MSSVSYFSTGIVFQVPKPRKTTSWIKGVISFERRSLEKITYIFCSDAYLLSLNQQFLKHDTLTDIITFDLSEDKNGPLSGEIYISIDRVRDNANQFKTEFETELYRVMIHGVLHLLGYGDKKTAEVLLMRKKEERYLSLRHVPRGTK